MLSLQEGGRWSQPLGTLLVSVADGRLRALYRILSLKWGMNATLREHVVIRFDQTAPGLFCSVQARCVDQP